jgi:hypothetical protein
MSVAVILYIMHYCLCLDLNYICDSWVYHMYEECGMQVSREIVLQIQKPGIVQFGRKVCTLCLMDFELV